MSRTEFDGILNVAKEQVPCGIYAIEKRGYAELMNIKCNSITQLKNNTRLYVQQGFKVYSNKVQL